MRFSFILVILCLLNSCSKDVSLPDEEQLELRTPSGFPKAFIPQSNPLTKAKIYLGKKLFYDPILSRDSSISCNSCHKQTRAFSDSEALSFGVDHEKGFRNAQALFNLAWSNSFFRDGGVTTLEIVPLNAIAAHFEFNNTLLIILKRLNRNSRYKELFRIAYNDTATINGFLHALACFQRTLISADSPFDSYYYQGNKKAISESAIRGFELFSSSKTDCIQCHSGFNFTNNTFQSNGSFETYPDSGRQRITLLADDRGKFRVPSLRNCELTAPYMHDGSINSLETVIELYNGGGLNFPGKSPLIRPLGLSTQEKADLLSFLKSLSDQNFIQNPEYRSTE